MIRSWLKKMVLLFVIAFFTAFLVQTPEAESSDRFPGRIIGGHEAEDGEWPWIAYLDLEAGNEIYYCGASLISPQWLVTAAHCTKDVDTITAIMGRYNLNTFDGEEISVEKWYDFPFYDDELTLNDISLLKLSRPVNRTTIPVIGRDAPKELLAPGKMGTVIGWGNTIPYGNATSDVLLEVELPVIDDDQVMQVMIEYEREHLEEGEEVPEYTPEIREQLRHAMFGAGYLYENKDAGGGDSGGPFMIQDEQGNWILAGLVSWGFEDAAQGAYGMYTRVSSYAYWITDMLDGTKVFNYLEETYPEIVGPAGSESELLGMEEIPVHYRCYDQKKACLAVTHGQLFYIGPLSDNQFVPIETIDYWLPLAENDG